MPIDTDRWDVTGTVTQTGGRAQFVVLGSNTSEIDNKFNDAPANPDISSATWRFAILTYNVTLDLTTGANTTEFGLYTTAGNFFLERTSSGTDLVVFTSSENYRDPVAASYSKTLEIERDAFTFSDWGGSTSYTDQESLVVDDSWYLARYTAGTSVGFNPPNSVAIASNRLTIETEIRTTSKQNYSNTYNMSAFDDDFLFEIEMDIYDIVGPAPAARFSPGAGLFVTIDGTLYGIVWLLQTTFVQGIQYYDGSTYTLLEANNTGGSWVLGIGRVGSTVTFYIDGVSKATETESGSVTNPVIFVNNNNGSLGNTGWTTDFYNLKSIVGGVEHTENFVFFNEDTDTRYVYDNGAVDVSAVSIKLTSNEALSDDTELISDFDFESPKGTRYQTEM